MFNKRHDELSNSTSSSIFGKKRNSSGKVLATMVRNNNIEEGVSAFTLWLGSTSKDSKVMPIAMKQFTPGISKVVVLLQDNLLQKDIIVDVVDGVPFCNECRSNDCAHVGFVICA